MTAHGPCERAGGCPSESCVSVMPGPARRVAACCGTNDSIPHVAQESLIVAAASSCVTGTGGQSASTAVTGCGALLGRGRASMMRVEVGLAQQG